MCVEILECRCCCWNDTTRSSNPQREDREVSQVDRGRLIHGMIYYPGQTLLWVLCIHNSWITKPLPSFSAYGGFATGFLQPNKSHSLNWQNKYLFSSFFATKLAFASAISTCTESNKQQCLIQTNWRNRTKPSNNMRGDSMKNILMEPQKQDQFPGKEWRSRKRRSAQIRKHAHTKTRLQALLWCLSAQNHGRDSWHNTSAQLFEFKCQTHCVSLVHCLISGDSVFHSIFLFHLLFLLHKKESQSNSNHCFTGKWPILLYSSTSLFENFKSKHQT